MWTCLTLTWADCNRSTQPCTQSCTHTHMHTFPPQTPPAISSLMHFFKRIQLALTQRGSNMARWALIPGWWINPKMLWHTTKDWSCLFIPSAKYPSGPLNSISSLSIFFLCQLEFLLLLLKKRVLKGKDCAALSGTGSTRTLGTSMKSSCSILADKLQIWYCFFYSPVTSHWCWWDDTSKRPHMRQQHILTRRG